MSLLASAYTFVDQQPPSSYQYAAQDPSNGFAQEDPGVNAFRRPGTASSTASTTYPSEQSAPSQQSDPGADPDEQQSIPQESHQAYANPSAEIGPSSRREPQRSKGPQYKLQAKITGLERTGRKDPILRFDVHVSSQSQQDYQSGRGSDADTSLDQYT